MPNSSELYDKIIKEIIDGKISRGLTNLIIFAQLKKDKDLERWATLESDGYLNTSSALRDSDIVPLYRSVVGQYIDQYNRPLIIKDPDLHFIQEDRLRHPVIELEEMSEKKNVLAYRDPKSIQLVNKYLSVSVDRFEFSPLVIKGVLNAIKNQIIKQLEKYAAGENEKTPTQTKIDAKQQKQPSSDSQTEYDVVLSFAGEDRQHAEKMADLLKADGFKVFYDKYEEVNLWGKNLYDHLSEVYSKQGKFCVMFLSQYYATKQWPTIERQNAQARAFNEHKEYILPIRIDDTTIPGIPVTICYQDVRQKDINDIYVILREKLSQSNSAATEHSVLNRHILDTGRNLNTFEKLIEIERWKKEFIDNREIWVCEIDNTYQVEVGEKGRDFTEAWTQVYPDKFGSSFYPVYLKINGVTIKQLSFVTCDGGRIFVPLPESKFKDKTQTFHWQIQSIAFKVGKIIGSFYIYNSLEGIAEASKILIDDK